MAFRLPADPSPFDDDWYAPETLESPDGPGRGKGSRPPTTGLLPPRQPHGDAPLVLLASDHRRDRAYVSRALRVAMLHTPHIPHIICCGVAEAGRTIIALDPAVIVIGDHSFLRWGTSEIALCRFLMQSLRTVKPVLLLSSGPRLFGKDALHDAYPAATMSLHTPVPVLAETLRSMLDRAARYEQGDWAGGTSTAPPDPL